MKEDFLYYLWKKSKWLNAQLLTTHGANLQVIYAGEYNSEQGPDFSFAKIIIDDISWVGQVEMHIKSSDWNKHDHSNDSNYNNVILHVVWIHDQEITLNGRILPTLELNKFIHESEVNNYLKLIGNHDVIPCKNLFSQVPRLWIHSQMDLASIQRLQDKILRLKNELISNEQNWESIFYKYFCKYLVTPTNADTMDILTNKIKWKEVCKVREDLFRLEAMFFGAAGMLELNNHDEYSDKLKNYFEHLAKKHEIVPMNSKNWYFLRLRPAHFPSLRLAQIASFFHLYERPFNSFIEIDKLNDARNFINIIPSDYWRNHYQFGKKSGKESSNILGDSTKDIIFINVIIPMIYMYGELTINDSIKEKALLWMDELKSESNKYTRMWEGLGFKPESARHSQACIQQYRNMCLNKKCIECKIGHYILNKNQSI